MIGRLTIKYIKLIWLIQNFSPKINLRLEPALSDQEIPEQPEKAQKLRLKITRFANVADRLLNDFEKIVLILFLWKAFQKDSAISIEKVIKYAKKYHLTLNATRIKKVLDDPQNSTPLGKNNFSYYLKPMGGFKAQGILAKLHNTIVCFREEQYHDEFLRVLLSSQEQHIKQYCKCPLDPSIDFSCFLQSKEFLEIILGRLYDHHAPLTVNKSPIKLSPVFAADNSYTRSIGKSSINSYYAEVIDDFYEEDDFIHGSKKRNRFINSSSVA